MKNAQSLFARLTEIEKIHIRGANDSRLELLADTAFRVDMPLVGFDERVAVLKEVQALCALETSVKSTNPGFGQTWLL